MFKATVNIEAITKYRSTYFLLLCAAFFQVLYTGPRKLWKMKAPNVTEEGHLIEPLFDISVSTMLPDDEPSPNSFDNSVEDHMHFIKV